MGGNPLSINDRIRNWNVDRCIPQEFNVQAEVAMLLEEVQELLLAKTPEEQLDALNDITVLAGGGVWKLGYDNDIAMDETLQEIEDRGGYYDVASGKWLKVIKDDAYKANYTKAKLR